jgi:aspartyl/asparaginyl beta-hydroxylase (cupin superfamily)
MERASRRLRAFLVGLDHPERRLSSSTPLQKPARFFPGLSAQPFHDPRRFAFTRLLEREAPRIRGEKRAALRAGGFVELEGHRALVGAGEWRRFPFYDHGLRDDSRCSACPITAEVIARVPGATAAGLAYFSALEAGTRILPHCGPTNTRLRCHLPLTGSSRATLTVAGQRRAAPRGKCLVFDDSFEHEAANPGKSIRVVLVIDLWHPELTAAEQAVLARRFAGDGGLRARPAPPWPPAAAQPGTSALYAFAAASVGGAPWQDYDRRR